jgi:hypothetical protein
MSAHVVMGGKCVAATSHESRQRLYGNYLCGGSVVTTLSFWISKHSALCRSPHFPTLSPELQWGPFKSTSWATGWTGSSTYSRRATGVVPLIPPCPRHCSPVLLSPLGLAYPPAPSPSLPHVLASYSPYAREPWQPFIESAIQKAVDTKFSSIVQTIVTTANAGVRRPRWLVVPASGSPSPCPLCAVHVLFVWQLAKLPMASPLKLAPPFDIAEFRYGLTAPPIAQQGANGYAPCTLLL